jgi:hypothetical protein
MERPRPGKIIWRYNTAPSIGTYGTVVDGVQTENKTKSDIDSDPVTRNTAAAVTASSAARPCSRISGKCDKDDAPWKRNAQECEAIAQTNSNSDGRTWFRVILASPPSPHAAGNVSVISVKISIPTAMSAVEKISLFHGK